MVPWEILFSNIEWGAGTLRRRAGGASARAMSMRCRGDGQRAIRIMNNYLYGLNR